jgi:hypothetical protein
MPWVRDWSANALAMVVGDQCQIANNPEGRQRTLMESIG